MVLSVAQAIQLSCVDVSVQDGSNGFGYQCKSIPSVSACSDSCPPRGDHLDTNSAFTGV